jgi:hypothetical protein
LGHDMAARWEDGADRWARREENVADRWAPRIRFSNLKINPKPLICARKIDRKREKI